MTTTPLKHPSLSTSKILEAVPKSAIKHGLPYLANAPTETEIKSVPTSQGLFVLTCNPVFIPGPTIFTSVIKASLIALETTTVNEGTTEQSIAPSKWLLSSFDLMKSLNNWRYSS